MQHMQLIGAAHMGTSIDLCPDGVWIIDLSSDVGALLPVMTSTPRTETPPDSGRAPQRSLLDRLVRVMGVGDQHAEHAGHEHGHEKTDH